MGCDKKLALNLKRFQYKVLGMKWTHLAFIFLFLPSLSSAAIYLRPTASLLSIGEKSSGVSTDSRHLFGEFAGGHLFDMGLLVGASYQLGQTKENYVSGVASSEVTESRTHLGVHLGYIIGTDNRFFIIGDYLYSSELSFDSTDAVYSGKGWQLEIGYLFPLKSIHVSFQLAYQQLKYTEYSMGGGSVTLGSPLEKSYLIPSFSAWWFFN